MSIAPDGGDESGQEGRRGVATADMGLVDDYRADVDGGSSNAAKGRRNRLDVYDEVEDFYLESGAAAVSIMQLPLCAGEEVVSEGEGELGQGPVKEIYLVGQSVSESREIRVLAEKWKLDLYPYCPPTFLVKTARGWLRIQKPKLGYRRIMNDVLTLAHFLHFSRKHPSASASITKEYLENEFRQFGENPSLEKLSDFFPVIRRYMKADLEMQNPNIFREFFPGHFSDEVASCTLRNMERRNFQEEKLPASGCTIEGTAQEVKHRGEGVKSTSNSKTSKAQRANVNAELRNLHSQWCTLLGGRATAKADKKCAPKKTLPLERQKSASRKSERKKSASKKFEVQKAASKKPEHKKTVRKRGRPRGRPPAVDRKSHESKKRHSSERESPVSKRRLTSIPSLESKTSTLDRQETSRPSARRLNTHRCEEKAMNLKRRETEPALSESAKIKPVPSKAKIMVGVHNPSTDIFDRLEDPPICTICDDGGDVICCEGPCKRHFHATPGKDTSCETLGMTSEQVKKIDPFYCNNCLLRRHQCFICQELGSSSPSLGPQEVYICDAPGCRKFYHPGCVAKVLDPELDWGAMADRIERGLHGFLCPRHSCAVCTSKEIQPGVFVQCRRCPKAWHRDCLTDFAFSGELPKTSIWKSYDQEFIYCKKHEILPDILTPAQDHLRFPKD